MARGTVNKVILLGRLGQDPDVRTTASGTQVATLNIATNELGPKQENLNQRETLTEWHKVIFFGRRAEVASEYLKKGSQVYVEGRLHTRKWQDQSGQDRYSTEIVGKELAFIGGRSDGQQGGFNSGGFGSQNNSQSASTPKPAGGGFDDFDDDVPF